MVASILALAAFYTGLAQDWQLKKTGKNLEVFTADVAHSAYKSVKVVCTVQATFSQVVAVLFDLDRQKDWVFNDKSSTLLKQVKENEMIYYSEVSVPWPGNNRDFIAHLTVTQLSPSVVTIDSHAEPDYIPERAGLVRITSSTSKWTMTAMGNNQIKINYVIQFDPGGSVPAWVINMFVTKGPYETFSKLQQRVAMPAYSNAHYDFIKE